MRGGGNRVFGATAGTGKVGEPGGRKGGPSIRHEGIGLAGLSPRGKLLATASNSSPADASIRIRVWDASTGKLRGEVVSPRLVHGLAFSPDEKTLAVACVA